MKTSTLSRRRSLLGLGALGTTPALLLCPASAQSPLPDKALRVLVGFVANGGTDIICRKICTPIERRLGRRIIVENRPGALGAIPGEVVQKSPPDGSTVAYLSSTTLVSKLLVKDFPFDPVTEVTPLSLAGTWPMAVAVSPKLGISTFDEYLKWLKDSKDPRHLKLGSTASDGFLEVFGRLIGKAVGVTIETTTYRGAAPMAHDLQEGRLSSAVSGAVSLVPDHRGGRLRLLMTTGPKRLVAAPNVPTARELGFAELEDTEWFAFFISAKTPGPLIAEWNKQVRAVLSDRRLIDELTQLGLDAETSTPEEAVARLASHLALWKDRIKVVGMEPAN
jgi:tripartite-type tricarboxylate transporter receptor subunit TctC